MAKAPRKEIGRAKSLVRQVILAQNNVYIRELLRLKGHRMGATKEQFEQNLFEAIDSGALTYEDLGAWIDEVEGWGDEHVYLYKVPPQLSSERVWHEAHLVEGRVRAAGLEKFWNADTSLAFPKTRRLTGIYFREGGLICVWQQGAEAEVRTPSRDFSNEIEGDTYVFKAFRRYGKRAVSRLVFRPSANLTAVFLPAAYDPDLHAAELQHLGGEVAKLIDISTLERFSVSDAIKALDSLGITGHPPRDLRTRNTKLSGGGASVEFSSSAGNYGDYEPVRNVRKAVEPSKFIGSVADFRFVKNDTNGLSRDVRVQLFGNQNRLRLYMRMTGSDVWTVLDRIVAAL